MRMFQISALASLMAASVVSVTGCGSDKGSDTPPSTGGTAGTGTGGGNSGGTAGNISGTGGATGGAGGAGGGAGTTACDLSGTGLTHAAIPNPTGTMTLTADKIWDLSDTTYVADGQTLTIEPCTRIEGQKTPLGTLVVSRGGKIMANGTANAPILFTSALPVGARAMGDWGGVILLGKAPNFLGTTTVNIEGLAVDAKNQHGGTDAADSSGSMKYVGILFPGFELSTGNEINGLTFGSVGTGTTIDHIFVGQSADDCYEWFGGTVNVNAIVGQNCDDDMFDTDYGYAGTITNAFGRDTVAPTESSNGLETGYDQATAITPVSNTNVTYKNSTVCGFGSVIAKVGYGILSRAYITGTVDEFVATGYDFGFNQEFPQTDTGLVIKNAVAFGLFGGTGNLIVNPADDQTKDAAFDEQAWWDTAGMMNSTTALAFTDADCKAANGPAAAVKSSARGAFKADATWADWVPTEWWSETE